LCTSGTSVTLNCVHSIVCTYTAYDQQGRKKGKSCFKILADMLFFTTASFVMYLPCVAISTNSGKRVLII
jgi:hypothetical protein